METKTIESKLLNEKYVEIDHKSGLKIFIMEKPDYTGAFAMFGTKYGSVDTCFKLKDEVNYTKVPEGIAHFLEHKLFESEDLDAFQRFEKTGANANAFTSFDKTCYIFQCADNFSESLEILLDFVKHPYFTEATVQKEQGIIGQEIKMYQDSPDWQVLFNLLRGLYVNNPVRIDIAGTVESIAQINADLLYSCYNTFYNLSNMALAVVGNVTVNQVLEIADKVLQDEKPVELEQIIPDEPVEAETDYIEEVMSVDIPKFAVGFKETISASVRTAKEVVSMNIALDIIAGKTSPLYNSLIASGLINPTFGSEYFIGRGFAAPMFSGESKTPEKVKDAILKNIENLKQNGINDDDFNISRKRLYGLALRSFNDVDDIAGNIVDSYFNGSDLFEEIECYKIVTKTDIESTIKTCFDTDKMCLSVIK